MCKLSVTLETQSVIDEVEDVVDVGRWDEVDDLVGPETGARGVNGVDEVDGNDQENALNRTGEGRQVKSS